MMRVDSYPTDNEPEEQTPKYPRHGTSFLLTPIDLGIFLMSVTDMIFHLRAFGNDLYDTCRKCLGYLLRNCDAAWSNVDVDVLGLSAKVFNNAKYGTVSRLADLFWIQSVCCVTPDSRDVPWLCLKEIGPEEKESLSNVITDRFLEALYHVIFSTGFHVVAYEASDNHQKKARLEPKNLEPFLKNPRCGYHLLDQVKWVWEIVSQWEKKDPLAKFRTQRTLAIKNNTGMIIFFVAKNRMIIDYLEEKRIFDLLFLF